MGRKTVSLSVTGRATTCLSKSWDLREHRSTFLEAVCYTTAVTIKTSRLCCTLTNEQTVCATDVFILFSVCTPSLSLLYHSQPYKFQSRSDPCMNKVLFSFPIFLSYCIKKMSWLERPCPVNDEPSCHIRA